MKPIETLTDDDFSALVRAAVALPDAPPALVKRAVGLWTEVAPSALKQVADAAINHIRAVLSFDSWTASPASLGLRASHSTQARHLMFSAPGRDIDVRVLSSSESFVIAGQILGPDDHGMVEITVDTHAENPHRVHSAPLDELGSFRTSDLRAGTYWMTLRLGDDAIELPPIDVGNRR